MTEIEITTRGAMTPGAPATVGELAKRLYGGMTYDVALPLEWLRRFKELTGLDPRGHFVWLYPLGGACGIPGPLTIEGLEALAGLGGARLWGPAP